MLGFYFKKKYYYYYYYVNVMSSCSIMSCPLIHVQGGSCRPLLAHAPDISITMESLWEYFA